MLFRHTKFQILIIYFVTKCMHDVYNNIAHPLNSTTPRKPARVERLLHVRDGCEFFISDAGIKQGNRATKAHNTLLLKPNCADRSRLGLHVPLKERLPILRMLSSRGLTQAHASLHIETWTLAGRIKMADKRLLMITDTERAYKVSTMTKKKKFH